MEKKIILASSSPRRKKILENLGMNFEIIPSDYDEALDDFNFSYEKIEKLAYNKAKSVFDTLGNAFEFIIISADTVVVIDNQILNKPESFENALQMLKSLSGRKHFVVTSICVLNSLNSKYKTSSCTSYVEFNELSEDLIIDYIKKFQPFDKAGSYGIQELPDEFVKNIEGSFENIVGLCSQSLKSLLDDLY